MNSSLPTHRPLLALTLGDVAGVGPEVAVRAALDPQVRAVATPLLVGHPDIVRRAAGLVGANVEVVEHDAPPRDRARLNRPDIWLDCWQVGGDDVMEVPPAQPDGRAGLAAFEYLVAAIDAALAGDVDAIVTAPLNKLALRQAGITHPGHTEILAERCGVDRHAMMLLLPQGAGITQPHGLSVAHTTLHTSIASVPRLLDAANILSTIELVDGFVRQLGCQSPRIGVCALNPHAGETGLFGDEEASVIAPAVEEARQRGIDARGPYPADTLFNRAAVDHEFDGIVAMYHDQGHIAFKLLGFDRAVNITLGLPIVRTSPSQGTAFDIAWRGIARGEGMIGAAITAAALTTRR
ncbi:MAG: 4-hydroxythreonine-4-phosphate dehydrogenase PdxA [Planctomycetaceae bacterium]